MSTSSNVGLPIRDRDRDRLSDRDNSIIGKAYQLVGVSGSAAVRAHFGTTAVASAGTAHAYPKALSRTTSVIRELLAIIGRLVCAGAGRWTANGMSLWPAASRRQGDQAMVVRAISVALQGT